VFHLKGSACITFYIRLFFINLSFLCKSVKMNLAFSYNVIFSRSDFLLAAIQGYCMVFVFILVLLDFGRTHVYK